MDTRLTCNDPGSQTEVDTTVFRSTNIKTDGLGRTNKNGRNTVDMIDLAMAQSGNALPQVSDGGSIQGVFHIVTTDGAGPLDPNATGAFSKGVLLNVDQQVPGRNGNIRASRNNNNKRTLLERAWDALASTGLIVKRAAHVNTDHPVKFTIPAGTKCTGTIKDQQNVCLVKIADSNPAGPFGGMVAIQQAPQGGAGGTAPASPASGKPARRAPDVAPEVAHDCPGTPAPPGGEKRAVEWSA
ncbi:hypothetical protein GGTG_01224 [Gaeumannomyces tritici R3-111a-1]|uniref:Uncharacterized protein n=1 Tax=Gaeumannomyces tritici (strain R3-111a-1) TaxID=644352 RepID=J3NIZ0_GAET3|nr:hypothetical protein GGTG_01224 [Gaeumannomyces tritici R3-111a-1]EJT81240.1 hypothetical protein GGTG_01224 [Gaeumannomyces tritici R3-111a-1]